VQQKEVRNQVLQLGIREKALRNFLSVALSSEDFE